MEIQVIEKTNGRINRVTGWAIKERLRVCAYCRVSTDNEEQLNSYQSQLKYYDEKINSKSEWQFAGIYADEAITGTLDFKITEFMRMIADSMSGKIDMILTKSISRFARNRLDTLRYVRMLREKNIAILFEEENLNTTTGAGELMLTILSAMAQQESENISSHVLLGLKMKKDRGELIGYNGCYGYNYNIETKEIIINEDEASIVRYMFERYVEGIGSSTIAKELTAKGIKTPKGGTKWCESTIRGILKNEKYIGDVLMGKTFTIDPISHKRLSNLGEVDKHYYKEHHEPIISKELFDRVQEIRTKRAGNRETGRRNDNYSKKYPFSSKLYCAFCGSLLTRRNWNANRSCEKAVWQCIKRAKQGKEECPHCKAYAMGYAHSNKFQDMTKGFAERVVLPFVNDIDSYLERIFTEMGFDENETYTIVNNGGQINISKGNSVINATQNNYDKVDELVKKIKEEINDNIEEELKEIIIDNVEGIQEEIKKSNMKKGRIKSFIDSLKDKALPKLGTAIQLTASITEIITFAQSIIS